METKLSLPPVEFAQRSDPGRDPDKQINEDSCGYMETRFGHLGVVCDGMGGHEKGREASNLAVKAILETFEASPVREDVPIGVRGRELLRQAIVAANQKVYELGGAMKHARPGSTVVAVLVHAEGTEIAHAGDSRCYLVHGGQIFQVTKDHSMVQKMVDAQLLTPAQAAAHPDANRILRALGSAPDVDVEVRAQSILHVAGDAFVLCSDGLSDLVEPPEILEITTSAPAQQAAGQLVDLANARGGHDNISVLILRARVSVGGAREPVSPTVTETLIQIPSPASLRAPASERPRVPLAPSGRPFAALAPPRRRPPLAVVLGMVLAVVGVGAGAFAIYLVLNPGGNAKHVAPFPFATLPPPSARPLAPGLPESLEIVPLSSAELDAWPPPAPLPSLVPSPKPRGRAHGG
jgi:protein phosphatase